MPYSDGEIRSIIITTIRAAFPAVNVIYTYGSYFSPYRRDESDIDIAFWASHVPYDRVEVWTVAEKIAAQLHRNVDLVDLSSASTVMQHIIVTEGTVIACYDTDKVAFFENRVMAFYQKLNEERRYIIEDVKKGVYFGG